MRKTGMSRILAMLLCIAMLVPNFTFLASALERSGGTTVLQPTKADPLAVVCAGSDIQYLSTSYNGVEYPDKYAANTAAIKDILYRIKLEYPTVNEAFLLGDYDGTEASVATSNQGVAAAYTAFNDVWGLGYDDILFVQGNHDPAGTNSLDTTGAHDSAYYGVYQLNEDDYPWGSSAQVTQTAAAQLDAYLDAKAEAGYSKPIFVITHLPLHHTTRMNGSRTDNSYARYIVDVLNEAGDKGLNIIFMFGHNHSGSYDSYIGLDCIYNQPGDSILVTKPEGGTVSDYESVPINFTYMNAGYLGYVAGQARQLTSTIFEIYEDRVEIFRYSNNGLVPLKKAGVSASSDLWEADTSVVESPHVRSLSDITLSVITNTLGEFLPLNGTADIQIGVESDSAYAVTWSSFDSSIAAVAQDPADPTKVTISGKKIGTTTVKVTVSHAAGAVAGAPAALYFDVTVMPENAVKVDLGEDGLMYQLVTDWSTLTTGKDYMILNTDRSGHAVALGGPTPESASRNQDSSVFVTKPTVFQIPGDPNKYTLSANGYDTWRLTPNSDNTAYNLEHRDAVSSFFAISGDVADDASYSYPSYFRMCSSTTSDGYAWLSIDTANKELKLHSYYEAESKETNTTSVNYKFSYNKSDLRFQLRAEDDTTGSPVYIYEKIDRKAPEMWAWVEGSGSIHLNGTGETGGEVVCMVDNEVKRVPITTDMLAHAQLALPGNHTCSVYYNGTLLTDQFSLTVLAEDGVQVNPVEIVGNYGTLYKLYYGKNMTGLPSGTQAVTVDRKLEGSGHKLNVLNNNGTYTFAVADTEVFSIEGMDGLYVRAENDGSIWSLEHRVSEFYHLKNVAADQYLHIVDDGTLGLRSQKVAGEDFWRLNSTLWTLTGYRAANDPQKVLLHDGSTYYWGLRNTDGAGNGVGFLYILDTSFDSIHAYVTDTKGTIQCGDAGELNGGETITVVTTYVDGTSSNEQVPITTEMLGLSVLELNTPGEYTCQLTYSGKVVCDNFVLTITKSDEGMASNPVAIHENKGQIFKLTSTMVQDKKYILVDKKTAGDAYVLSITDKNLIKAEPVRVYTSNTTDGLYVSADGSGWIFTAQTRPNGGSQANFNLFNETRNGYLCILTPSQLNLGFVDASKPEQVLHGWRSITAGYQLVTNDDELLNGVAVNPYASIIRSEDTFIAVPRGKASAPVYIYEQDDTLLGILAYLDQGSGTVTAGCGTATAPGGNVIIKTYLKDGTVGIETVPITVDMLDLDAIQRFTPGSYTCTVTYDGVELFDGYQLTVTPNAGETPAADDPVVILEDNGQLFKKGSGLVIGKDYMFVHNPSGDQGYAVSVSEVDGAYVVSTQEGNLFNLGGSMGSYFIAESDNAIWTPENKVNAAGKTVLSLRNVGCLGYLYVDENYNLTIQDGDFVIPHGSSWRSATAGALACGASSSDIPYASLRYDGENYIAVDRSANLGNIAYIYTKENNLEMAFAYVDTLTGECAAGSEGTVQTGGNVVVKTLWKDGTTHTESIPITLNMLKGLNDLALYVPGTYTCSVWHGGVEITDSYKLTITADEGDHPAADIPVHLTEGPGEIYRLIKSGFVAGKQYVFVDTDTQEMGHVMAVGTENGDYVLGYQMENTFSDGTNVYIRVKEPAAVWDTQKHTQDLSLYNSEIGKHLLATSNFTIYYGDAPVDKFGWRLASTGNLGTNGGIAYTDAIWDGHKFALVPRYGAADSEQVFAYERVESIDSVVAYVDSLTGELPAAAAGNPLPGGNVIIKNIHSDGTTDNAVVPIDISMLRGIDLKDLHTPGTYTCSVWFDDVQITDKYVLTITGTASESIMELPGDGAGILGQIVTLDSAESDDLPVGSGGTALTGSSLLTYTYKADGTVEKETLGITVSMLNATTTQLNTAGSHSGLTLTYQGNVITDNYTLNIEAVAVDDYPDFPDEGSVRIDKQLDMTKYSYLDTGSAQINLSVTGIPNTGKANVVIVLDASSSMNACTHGRYHSEVLTQAQRDAVKKSFDLTAELTQEEIDILSQIEFNPDSYQARYQAALAKRLANEAMTASDLKTLKNAFGQYGYCQDAENWVGDTTEYCQTRREILRDALKNLLEYLKQDINGYAADIDVAVVYFNEYQYIDESYSFLDDPTMQPYARRSNNELMLPFTKSTDINVDEVVAKYVLKSGTNFDRGMEWAYQLLSEKQTADYQDYLNSSRTEPFEARKDFVLFMTDGDPGQYNYMQSGSRYWGDYISGRLSQSLDHYVDASWVDIFGEMYNEEGKLWLAEAIKGDKTKRYKVIDPSVSAAEKHVNYVHGLGATMMTVKFAEGSSEIMTNIASDSNHFFEAHTSEEINHAFTWFAEIVRAANGATFLDQMGKEFDLQMNNTIITSDNKTVELNPTITVKKYELYKYSETLVENATVTMDMVGKRKDVAPQVLETITFSDDGTAAYSNGDTSKNILDENGVICAKNFWYNTNTEIPAMIDTDANGTRETSLQPETFYWNVGSIPEDELVLTYSVYLTGTIEATRTAGSYATNNFATLYYTNQNGNKCSLSAQSPMLPWGQAVVGYGFYMVDGDGNPIINKDTFTTGSFEQSIRLTQPMYLDLLLNSDENLEPWELVAQEVLPEGYTLYDPTAKYKVQLFANGNGSWAVEHGTNKLTTYVTGYGGNPTTKTSATAGKSTDEESFEYPAYATSSTVVWFAVRGVTNAVADTVVVDYGLPVDIKVLANDVVITPNNSTIAGIGDLRTMDTDGVDYTSELAEGFATTYTNNFGKAEIVGSAIRYTLSNMAMDRAVTFSYAAHYTGENNVNAIGAPGYYYSSVTVIPATSIYFEDSFVDFIVVNGAGEVLENESWTKVGSYGNKTQDEDRPGNYSLPEIDANNLYGHDSAYEGMTEYSMGSAMMVNVNANRTGRAQFEFTGTGFDVVSLTSDKTGTIMVRVYELDDEGNIKDSYVTGENDTVVNPYKSFMVDTYYGYKYEDGKWVVDPDASDTLYQVPVIKVEGLPFNKYKALISASYNKIFDHQQYGDKSYDFYLDAIRIYDPAKGSRPAENAHKQDGEGWPTYQELRDLLITANDFDSINDNTADEVTGVVFIDNTLNQVGTPAVADYLNYGPNNELYLKAGQAVAFGLNLTDDGSHDTNIDSIHLGMKSAGGAVKVKVYNAKGNQADAKEQTITSATDMYYDITYLNGQTVVIYNSGKEDTILSVTNIKTTYHNAPDAAESEQPKSAITISKASADLALESLQKKETDAEPTITLNYPSLSFEDEVLYNVYFSIENLDSEVEDMGLLTWTSKPDTADLNSAEEIVAGAVSAADGKYMVQTNGIPAKNMADNLYLMVYAKCSDGSYVYSPLTYYNAKLYAMDRIANSTSDEMKALCVAMLNYGAAAQQHFGYKTDSLMNGDLTAAQKALVPQYCKDMVADLVSVDADKIGEFAYNGGFAGGYPSVSFDGIFTINYYFTPKHTVDGTMTLYFWDLETYNRTDTLTVENASGKAVMKRQANGAYSASCSGIAAKEISDSVFAAAVYESGGTRYTTGIQVYSLGVYCVDRIANGSQSMQALAEATVVYGSCASNYFN